MSLQLANNHHFTDVFPKEQHPRVYGGAEGRFSLAGRAVDPWMGVLSVRPCRSLNAERVREAHVPSLENPHPLDAS